MEDLEVNNYLIKENLFELFKMQLKKDFSTCGLSIDFIENLPVYFGDLKFVILQQLKPLFKTNSQLSNLLYRVDISEVQLKKYQPKNNPYNFEEAVAELIIKRTLQKIIFKKIASQ